jgi:predicted HD superfamily hydrolase involved in NAD metabolism
MAQLKEIEDYQSKIEDIQCKMKELLPATRYEHTLGVAHLASAIAMCYGENAQKSMLAGLLHDNARYMEHEQSIYVCEQNHIEVTEAERNNPMLLHGKLGAFFARTRYGIEDVEILSAISYHTTGKTAMSFLEKNVFLADYIEPRRKQQTNPELNIIRMTAFHNLDLAVYYALDNTLRYLKRSSRTIEVLSEQALEYYKNIVKLD